MLLVCLCPCHLPGLSWVPSMKGLALEEQGQDFVSWTVSEAVGFSNLPSSEGARDSRLP
jgi:hypothetical protein